MSPIVEDVHDLAGAAKLAEAYAERAAREDRPEGAHELQQFARILRAAAEGNTTARIKVAVCAKCGGPLCLRCGWSGEPVPV